MAAVLILAITADGEVRVVRERGEQVEEVGGVGLLHLGAEFSLEGHPSADVIAGAEGEGDKVGRGGQSGEPDIIEIAFREVGFRHSTGRAADGAEAEAFMRPTRGAEADGGDGHRDRVQRTADRVKTGAGGYGLGVGVIAVKPEAGVIRLHRVVARK